LTEVCVIFFHAGFTFVVNRVENIIPFTLNVKSPEDCVNQSEEQIMYLRTLILDFVVIMSTL